MSSYKYSRYTFVIICSECYKQHMSYSYGVEAASVSVTAGLCCGLFITLLGGEKSRRNLRLQLVLQAAFELHNVGEIQLSPIISGSHVIHHFY